MFLQMRCTCGFRLFAVWVALTEHFAIRPTILLIDSTVPSASIILSTCCIVVDCVVGWRDLLLTSFWSSLLFPPSSEGAV